jgi:ATPase subunit of ABC transporter with duplicated ATPase domains
VRNYDEKMKAMQSGLEVRPVTTAEVLKHLAEFGITEELGRSSVRGMSAGQKSRLVLAAAMWTKPHLVALDEPTNYIDNETLNVLVHALKGFKGGVVCITHNEAFVSQVCNETWTVAGKPGTVTCPEVKRRGGD